MRWVSVSRRQFAADRSLLAGTGPTDAERRAEQIRRGVLVENHEVVPAHHKNLVMEQRNITCHEAFDRSRCGDSNLGASEHM
jgi:hypothetical protein